MNTSPSTMIGERRYKLIHGRWVRAVDIAGGHRLMTPAQEAAFDRAGGCENNTQPDHDARRAEAVHLRWVRTVRCWRPDDVPEEALR